ncbi:uncharacterized protein M421DRAFT_193007 [Didymella exigua CBS 183.55]|uniref:Uncharacterized protein n=1 Tax=Didymella exigua CBS 183.55 TaxID=1150837 RepID=A0A6A5RXZ8_9PLEO|nr:uncharacterized protein M421DRAFT_193007 [Didymella exigua CBS 183.55]KAF1933271.1 hypothetical protein M421DRAFT_193007 [Didymella exigua CBS 183.55]
MHLLACVWGQRLLGSRRWRVTIIIHHQQRRRCSEAQSGECGVEWGVRRGVGSAAWSGECGAKKAWVETYIVLRMLFDGHCSTDIARRTLLDGHCLLTERQKSCEAQHNPIIQHHKPGA